VFQRGGAEVTAPATKTPRILDHLLGRPTPPVTRRQNHALRVPLALEDYRFWMVVVDNTNDRPHRR
jgi:hypothetical protein